IHSTQLSFPADKISPRQTEQFHKKPFQIAQHYYPLLRQLCLIPKPVGFLRSVRSGQRSILRQASLLFLEFQFPVMRHDLDAIARLELTEQQLVGEGIQEQILNRSLERARAKLWIVALFGQ